MSEFICPSCMWQGDFEDIVLCPNCGKLCPACGEVVQRREEYDRQEAENNRDEELEERRNNE